MKGCLFKYEFRIGCVSYIDTVIDEWMISDWICDVCMEQILCWKMWERAWYAGFCVRWGSLSRNLLETLCLWKEGIYLGLVLCLLQGPSDCCDSYAACYGIYGRLGWVCLICSLYFLYHLCSILMKFCTFQILQILCKFNVNLSLWTLWTW